MGKYAIYIGSINGYMYAVSFKGKVKWKFKTGSDIRASAVIDKEENVYFGSWDNFFYSLDKNGKLRWKYNVKGPVEASACIDKNDRIYVPVIGKRFYVFNADGKVLWTLKRADMFHPSPIIGEKGIIYWARVQNVIAIGEKK